MKVFLIAGYSQSVFTTLQQAFHLPTHVPENQNINDHKDIYTQYNPTQYENKADYYNEQPGRAYKYINTQPESITEYNNVNSDINDTENVYESYYSTPAEIDNQEEIYEEIDNFSDCATIYENKEEIYKVQNQFFNPNLDFSDNGVAEINTKVDDINKTIYEINEEVKIINSEVLKSNNNAIAINNKILAIKIQLIDSDTWTGKKWYSGRVARICFIDELNEIEKITREMVNRTKASKALQTGDLTSADDAEEIIVMIVNMKNKAIEHANKNIKKKRKEMINKRKVLTRLKKKIKHKGVLIFKKEERFNKRELIHNEKKVTCDNKNKCNVTDRMRDVQRAVFHDEVKFLENQLKLLDSMISMLDQKIADVKLIHNETKERKKVQYNAVYDKMKIIFEITEQANYWKQRISDLNAWLNTEKQKFDGNQARAIAYDSLKQFNYYKDKVISEKSLSNDEHKELANIMFEINNIDGMLNVQKQLLANLNNKKTQKHIDILAREELIKKQNKRKTSSERNKKFKWIKRRKK